MLLYVIILVCAICITCYGSLIFGVLCSVLKLHCPLPITSIAECQRQNCDVRFFYFNVHMHEKLALIMLPFSDNIHINIIMTKLIKYGCDRSKIFLFLWLFWVLSKVRFLINNTILNLSWNELPYQNST